ncbi:MAG: VWA domain-containing protein [Bacteroidales bacterium]|nr:VWA domain-containing protein [Bacteroidales bacterium]
MGLQLVTAYSYWLIPLCLAFGAGLAAVLYYRNTPGDFSRNLRWILSLFRFLSGSIVAFLLLSPMIKTIVRTTEKPVVVIAVDNSGSMILGKDSLFVMNELSEKLDDLAGQLGDDFDLVRYTFGEQVIRNDSLDFSGKLTDISAFITQLNNRYYNRNLGAVILASDGIYNVGSDPSYLVRDVSYPVYTINTGDTNQHRDLLIKRINYNRLAYKGNRFPIEILVQAYESAGESSLVKVYHKEVEIFSEEIRFISDKQVVTIPVTAAAEETGKLRFRINIEPIDGEANESNNTREIVIEVKEGRQKIAIVGNSPHPDLAAIERALGNSNNFETELFFADNFTENPANFSLFILHQLPSVTNQSSKLLGELARLNVPVLYILGNQSDISLFNAQKSGLSLSGFNNSFNESLPVFNADFPLFISSENLKQLLQIVPPLNTPFAKYSIGNAAYIYANQAIGASATSMPLIFFNQNPDRRTGVIAGEGIWRWRLADYSKNQNQLAFDELFGKMAQYLAVKDVKSRFRVSARDFYAENENIEFGATLFNESYELINDKLVTLVIIGEDGKKYEFEFTPAGESYQLNAGNFKPGIFRFQASAETGTGTLMQQGSFVITALNLEDINTVANHKLLNTMAELTGGSGFDPGRIPDIANIIKSRKDIKPVTYVRKRYTDLISFLPLLLLIIGLLGTEWFLRKYYGSY